MRGPGGLHELVFDQPVGRRIVGHAQQRLGEHHQREAFFGRERIFLQKIFDRAQPMRNGANTFEKKAREPVNLRFGFGRQFGSREQARGEIFVRSDIGR